MSPTAQVLAPRAAVPAVAADTPRSHPWMTLAAVSLGVAMTGLDSSVVAVANPAIGQDLRASTSDLQWVTNAYLLALAATLIFGGKLGDRFGRRTIYLTGIVGFTVASVVIGLSGSITGVVTFRGVQGFFGAMMLPNTLGILRATFPRDKFTMAVGIWAMVSSASAALGPIVGGYLVENLSWQYVFYLNAPIGLIALIFGAAVLPRSRTASARTKFDIPGVLMLALGQGVLVFAIVGAQSRGWTAGSTLMLLSAGLITLLFFAWYESRTPHPLLPLRLFRNRSLTIGASITALNFLVLLGSMFFVMLYLQNVQGLTPGAAGLATLPMSLATLVAAPAGATLTKKFGARATMPAGLILLALACLLMCGWEPSSPYAALWPPLALLGLGSGVIMAATSEAVLAGAPIEDAGVAGGIQSTAIQIGGALGTSILISLIGSRVAFTFTSEATTAGVPVATANGLSAVQDAVTMGGTPPTEGLSAPIKSAVVESSHQAFINGLHTAALSTCLLSLAGAVIAAVGIRRRGALGP